MKNGTLAIALVAGAALIVGIMALSRERRPIKVTVEHGPTCQKLMRGNEEIILCDGVRVV